MAKKLTNAVVLALTCRCGTAMVEYALLAALVAVVAIVSLRTIGTNVSVKFSAVTTAM